MTLPDVDVVILTWNDGALLERAVRSALDSEDVRATIVVVDNGSDPPAEVVVDPRVALVRLESNVGVSRGRNIGVRAGTASLVCLLDSDAVLHRRTLAVLADAGAVSGVGLTGPVFSGQRPEDSGGAAPTLYRKVRRVLGWSASYGSTRDTRSNRWDVDFVIGACQLFRRDAYDAVGGIDERWFYGPEDADFCMRLREAGWRVVQCQDAACDHPPRRRNRRLLTRRGLAHAKAVAEFLWRHRHYEGVNG